MLNSLSKMAGAAGLGAVALLAAATAAADHHTAALRVAAPNPATAGTELTLTGDNLLVASGSYRSTVRYATRTGGGREVILGTLPSSGWSRSQVRVRLPRDLEGGTYHLAIFRNGALASNWIQVRVGPQLRAAPPAVVLPSVRLTRGPIRASAQGICGGETMVRVTGGPFEPGTEINRAHARWERGKTFVELQVEDDPRTASDNSRYWNSMIYGVRIVNERELQVRVARCFVAQPNRRIRVIYPDGAYSDWATVGIAR